jgi:hypothetical protein
MVIYVLVCLTLSDGTLNLSLSNLKTEQACHVSSFVSNTELLYTNLNNEDILKINKMLWTFVRYLFVFDHFEIVSYCFCCCFVCFFFLAILAINVYIYYKLTLTLENVQ